MKNGIVKVKSTMSYKVLKALIGSVFVALLMGSCSVGKTMSNNFSKKPLYMSSKWKRATANFPSTLTVSNDKESFKLYSSIQISSKTTLLNHDSVEITTYSGKKYVGVIVKEEPEGYFIRVNNYREIYLAKFEIKSFTYYAKEKEVLNSKQEKSDIVESPKKNSLKKKQLDSSLENGESSYQFNYQNKQQDTELIKKSNYDEIDENKQSDKFRFNGKSLLKIGKILLKIVLGVVLAIVSIISILIILLI